MSQIEIIGLKKSFQENGLNTEVLKGISLSINEGEVLGIVGPSGAGKSTLLHIIGTLDAPTEGRVLFEGDDLFKLKNDAICRFRNRSIGFVFQFHHLLPDFTAIENVMMPLLIRGEPKRRASGAAGQMLQKVDLSDRGHHKPAELSGGEQQRVAIARALVGAPKVILADEPTGNLDHESGRKIFDLLLKLNKELNTTLIVVSHNEELVRRLGRTLRLVDGQIEDSH